MFIKTQQTSERMSFSKRSGLLPLSFVQGDKNDASTRLTMRKYVAGSMTSQLYTS